MSFGYWLYQEMMKYVTFDVETTTSNKGNPFDKSNRLVCYGLRYGGDSDNIISFSHEPEDRERVDRIFRSETYMVVGFNLKFDLNWWRRIGGVYPKRVWDCQIAEFLLSNQEAKYPSLDDALLKYGFPPKLDVVKTEYWDKGINTDQVPREILSKYLAGDLEKTEQVFKQQYHMFHSAQYKHLYPLFKLQCMDLLVLADMEWNGVLFNVEKALAHANKVQKRQDEIQRAISEYVGNVPFVLTSDAHLSAILYGGIILEEFRIPIGVYKSGAKAGQPRYKIAHKTYEFPQLIAPLKGSQVKEKVSQKELEFIQKGILTEPRKQYAVNEDTLKQLKPSKQGRIILDLIMENNKLDKLRSTYLEGWPKLIEKMNWEPGMLHSQLNQVLAITGRLSSSNPNGQNADKMTKLFCESRYD
jgi:DNA polymerase I-like protein with 3'-5' exonuclease and polymerase domains